jgi:hypothetical protein
LGDTGADVAHAVAVDRSIGSIYVVGELSTPLNDNDAFLARFDPSGNLLGGEPILLTTPNCDGGSGVTVDNSGNIYVTGWTRGNLDDMDGLPWLGEFDAFLAKFSPSGVRQWTKVWGTSDIDNAISTVVAGANIYVGGDTLGSLNGYTNSGGYDLFLLKFNTDGQRQ